MSASHQHARAIVCEIHKMAEHALQHDMDRMATRAALRNALLSSELTWYERYLLGETAEVSTRASDDGNAA
jgi:hypothetical protein